MNIQIPPKTTRRWTGPYLGNYYGTLYKTFNVDLDRSEGRIGLARRLQTEVDTTDTNTDTLQTAYAFIRTNSDCTDRYWALSANNRLYKGDSIPTPTGAWTADALDSSPTDPYDMATFENDTSGDTGKRILFVTRSTDIAALNDSGTRVWTNSWWVAAKSGTALKGNVPHPIEYFSLTKIMVIGDANRVHTISRVSPTTATVINQSRLIFPTELQIQHIFVTVNRVWFVCINLLGGNGKIVEWDGFSQNPNAFHDAYSATPLTGVNYKEIPIVINDKGYILEFTGNSFAPMIRNGQPIAFPIVEELNNNFQINSTTRKGGIQPRGVTVSEDGLIYMNVMKPDKSSFRQGAGIWCLNPQTGRLYNKFATGIWGDTDFGQQQTFDAGAIYNIPSDTSGNKFLIGASPYTNATGNVSVYKIMVLAAPTNTTALRGYFITQFLPSSEIRDAWDSLWVRFQRFINTGNRIVVKAKSTRSLMNATYLPLEATITWATSTTFTLTLAASDDALAVGDEVEIVRGPNAGVLAHITVISGAHAASQTITIDETVADPTNASTAIFDRWKKLGVISNAQKYEDVVNIGIKGSFIQFKVEMRGPSREMEIDSLIVNSEPDVHLKK